MKCIDRIEENNSTVLVIEKKILFGLLKYQDRYIATEEFPKGYWNWRKLPNRTLVGSSISFQLDSWNKDFINQ